MHAAAPAQHNSSQTQLRRKPDVNLASSTNQLANQPPISQLASQPANQTNCTLHARRPATAP
eukprot:365702-Chlamydomonas_euryale.AAC.20